MKTILSWCLAVAALFLLVACGGGGSSSGGGTGSRVNLFITDNMNAGYSAVWVRIFEIELDGPGGSVNVFRSPEGVEVNLRALNNGVQLFRLMTGVDIPAGNYQGAWVTMSKNLTVTPTAGIGSPATFAAAFDHASGRSRVPVTFLPAFNPSVSQRLVLDFALDQWTIAGGIVTPSIIPMNGAGLDDGSRHVGEDYKGTISGLAANSFTLTLTAGGAVTVSFNGSTTISTETGTLNLANGQTVEVTGTFNPVARTLDATHIKIDDGAAQEPKVKGAATNLDANLGSLTIATTVVRGFLPSNPTVLVLTTTGTRFFAANGALISRSEFFAQLTALGGNAKAEAEGSYDANTNTITAAKVEIEAEGEDEARGAVTASNAGAGTLTIALNEWFGFSATAGSSLNITTSGSTTYRDANGDTVNAATFFAAVSNGTVVKAHGSVTGTTLAATRLEIRTGGGGGGNDPHEAKGYAGSGNVGAGTFQMQLVSWFGFSGGFGSILNVTMAPGATYRDDNGNSISQAQFFAALNGSQVAEVDGTFANGTFTAVKAKLDN